MNRLQKSLFYNAIFSGSSSLAFIIFSKSIANHFGLETNTPIWVIGLALMYFTLSLFYEILRQRKAWVKWIIIQDLFWVIGSIFLLTFEPVHLSLTGKLITAIIAIIVFFMAVNQQLALAERIRFSKKIKSNK